MKVTILYPGGKLGKPTTGGQVYDFNLFKILHDEGVELDYLCDEDRKSTRLNSSHEIPSRMPSSA